MTIHADEASTEPRLRADTLRTPTTTVVIDGAEPLSAKVVARVNALCDQVEDLGGIAVLQVSGVPDASAASDVEVALVNRWERALRRLERKSPGTIAIVDGDCGGTAMEALLVADYRIGVGEPDLFVPDERAGAGPGMFVYRLSTQLGPAHARAAVLFGTPISAAEAMDLRLLDAVADDAEAGLGRALALVGPRSGTELAIRRRLLFDAASVSFEDALGVHLAACARTLSQTSAEAAR